MSEQSENKSTGQLPFLQRWSQLKQSTREHSRAEQTESQPEQQEAQTPQATQQDLPDLETLHEGSDIGMFLADGVSESLQRAALRKLFHFGKFNICDGLDDYAEDYTIFKPLEKLVGVHDKLKSMGDRLQTGESSDFESASATPTEHIAEEDTEITPSGCNSGMEIAYENNDSSIDNGQEDERNS